MITNITILEMKYFKIAVYMQLTLYSVLSHLETAPHLLSLVKDVKLDKYTVPTRN